MPGPGSERGAESRRFDNDLLTLALTCTCTHRQLRSLTLPGADSTPTLDSLTDRFVAAGVTGSCGALSIKQIRDDVIPLEELERSVEQAPLTISRKRIIPTHRTDPVSSLYAVSRVCIFQWDARRVAKIEQIDEVEELNLVLEHYAVSWANVTPPSPTESSTEIGLRRRRRD